MIVILWAATSNSTTRTSLPQHRDEPLNEPTSVSYQAVSRFPLAKSSHSNFAFLLCPNISQIFFTASLGHYKYLGFK